MYICIGGNVGLRLFFFHSQRFKAQSQQRKLALDLAGGYSAMLFSFVGDLDYYYSVLGLPNSRSVNGPCTTLSSPEIWNPLPGWISPLMPNGGNPASQRKDGSSLRSGHLVRCFFTICQRIEPLLRLDALQIPG